MKIPKISQTEAYFFCKATISKFSEKDYLSIEIKKYKPEKTQKQLGLFFEALDFFCRSGGYKESDKYWIRKGIEEQYSFRKKNAIGQLVPIPLSECNRWEQFEVFYNGLFNEAYEQGIDMSDFITQYEQLRKEQRKSNEKNNNAVGIDSQ